MREVVLGGVEGGGTRFVCAVAVGPGRIVERIEVRTTDAAATLAGCVAFFQAAAARHGPVAALGIGCFGPLQLRGDAADHGCLLPTPKPGWAGANLLAPFRETLGVPLAIDTDVSAAARAELTLGAGRGAGSLAYVTVGTGIGGAVAPAAAGPRLMHAEMGHLAVRRDPRDEGFAGICPFHGDCLEGLASGPAIVARWGCQLDALPAQHPGRDIIAGYIGQLAASIVLVHAPERLVLGGGVMTDGSLLPAIRRACHGLLGGYLPPLRAEADVARFITAPALGGAAGITGALLMAQEALLASAS